FEFELAEEIEVASEIVTPSDTGSSFVESEELFREPGVKG
ncbi:34670_t:CDS:1, partial [Racocetra persica]